MPEKWPEETPALNYPPVTHVLSLKTMRSNNIIVGDDATQVSFLEQFLGSKAIIQSKVCDEHLVGVSHKLYQVSAGYQLDISPEIRERTGVWSATPIVKGSASINALVKHAAQLAGVKSIKKETVNLVGDRLTKQPILDIKATIWAAVWLLTGDLAPTRRWSEPWENHIAWMQGVEPALRLHSLYRRLVAYTLLRANHQEAVNAFGVKPSEQAHIRELVLDVDKVYDTLTLLSQWRQAKGLPLICALRISSIWQK